MIKHVVCGVIRNKALADKVVGRVLDPRRAVITGYHVVQLWVALGGVDEEEGV